MSSTQPNQSSRAQSLTEASFNVPNSTIDHVLNNAAQSSTQPSGPGANFDVNLASGDTSGTRDESTTQNVGQVISDTESATASSQPTVLVHHLPLDPSNISVPGPTPIQLSTGNKRVFVLMANVSSKRRDDLSIPCTAKGPSKPNTSFFK